MDLQGTHYRNQWSWRIWDTEMGGHSRLKMIHLTKLVHKPGQPSQYSDQAMGQMTVHSSRASWQGQDTFPFCVTFRVATGSPQTPIEWVLQAVSTIIHLPLVSRLMVELIHRLEHNVSMAWQLIKLMNNFIVINYYCIFWGSSQHITSCFRWLHISQQRTQQLTFHVILIYNDNDI